jgi:lipoprotein-anchoring transpeptidase ErfK/SrfK
MRQRSFIILSAALVIALVGSFAIYAYDSAHDDQIAKGVSAGGVDIGGMKTAAARAKVSRELAGRLERPLYAAYHDARFRLTPEQIRFRIDVDGMVDEALRTSRGGNMLTRTFRGVFGGKLHENVPVEASYSKAAVDTFVKRIEHRLNRPAQDATLDFSTGTLERVKARKGREVKAEALRQEVEHGLSLPTRNETVPVSVASTHPKVTTRELTAKYGTVIAINRGAYQLTLFKRLKRVKTYTIAVGRQGLETPAGQYSVADKQINPSWHVPNSSWAGSLAGRVIPPGPQDPLKARWIGIVDGAGIHGTDDVGSLGSNASHGCIRMAIPDVIELFDRTPYGSKIFIH